MLASGTRARARFELLNQDGVTFERGPFVARIVLRARQGKRVHRNRFNVFEPQPGRFLFRNVIQNGSDGCRTR
jgi:hypothetical protein